MMAPLGRDNNLLNVFGATITCSAQHMHNGQDHLEWFEERAAIMEHDGGLSRLEAQRRAYWEWRRHHPNIEAPQAMIDLAMEYKRKVAG